MGRWLEVRRGSVPLIVSFPHTGTEIPGEIEERLISPWRARKDTDWWVHQLYDMTQALHITTVRTSISRTVIDVNRDPSGASLYPGQATTDLCPLATFDGEPLYRDLGEPDATEIVDRRVRYFDPYHAALSQELRWSYARFGCVVLYDAHSIRSRVPRLFDGTLPDFNVGTYDGASCDMALTRAIENACAGDHFSCITNARFKGGWTTRHYGEPLRGVHAVQMELACGSYLDEPDGVLEAKNWPPEYDPARAAPIRVVLTAVLQACIAFAHSKTKRQK